MKWTKDIPTKEGWYFWRPSNARYHDSLHYRVEYVEPDMLGITPYMRQHGEWAGPISEPE